MHKRTFQTGIANGEIVTLHLEVPDTPQELKGKSHIFGTFAEVMEDAARQVVIKAQRKIKTFTSPEETEAKWSVFERTGNFEAVVMSLEEYKELLTRNKVSIEKFSDEDLLNLAAIGGVVIS